MKAANPITLIRQHNPFVSVCIPVYNGENYVHECISSVLEQNYTNLELLIVDNCSTDSTPDIIRSTCDSRVRVLSNESNIGSVRNFNKCIEEAKGEYFLLLPHDDILLPGGIMNFVRGFSEPAVGIVYSSIRVINAKGDVTSNKVNHSKNQLFSPEKTLLDIVDNFHPIQLAMARTDVVKRLGGFDIEFGVFCDIHLWLKVIFEGWNSFYYDKPLSCHRSHAQQGQHAFLNNDLDELSKHWGKRLGDTFWQENSVSNLFLKLSDYLLEEIRRCGELEEEQHVREKLIELFAGYQIPNLKLAISGLNSFALRKELKIIALLSKQSNYFNIFSCYSRAILRGKLNRLLAKFNK